VIAFTLRLVSHSGRWFAPFFAWLLWLAIVFSPPGRSLGNAASMFAAFVMWTLWMAGVAGNVDDSPHRDLLAAAAGSAARLHAMRSIAVLGAASVLAAVTTVLNALLSDEAARTAADPVRSVVIERSEFYVAAGTLGLLLAGAAIGLAVGTWLQRPILDLGPVVVLVGFVTVSGVLVLGPVQWVMRGYNASSASRLTSLLPVSCVLCAASVIGAAAVAGRRAR
jgi:hypothetical protein